MTCRSILQKADEQIAALLIATLGYATVQTHCDLMSTRPSVCIRECVIVIVGGKPGRLDCCDAHATSGVGHQRRSGRVLATSAVPPGADISLRCTK